MIGEGRTAGRSVWWRGIRVGVVSVTIAGRVTFAQVASQAPSTFAFSATQDRADSLGVAAGVPMLPLPVSRRLDATPPVEDVGTLTAVDGARVVVPLTASLAYQDLLAYDAQLSARFPESAARVPSDSLARLRVARATAWLDRVRHWQGPGVEGSQRLALAAIASRAGRDDLVQRYLDRRLAEMTAHPVDQAVALATGVVLLTDRTQDDARRVRNFPVAERYLRRLLSLPQTGYTTKSDSLTVRQQQRRAASWLLGSVGYLHDPSILLPRFWSIAAALPFDERLDVVRTFPYRVMAAVIGSTPNGRARLDSLEARLAAFLNRRANEWPASTSPAQRVVQHEQDVHTIRDGFAPFALIGHSAPPIMVHAWLHTPDSAYAPHARALPLADGVIRVIAFGGRTSETVLRLDRVQQQLPPGAQVVFVTGTQGHGGSELLQPDEEVAWLNTFFTRVRHVMIPIAIWAGALVAQESPLPPTDIPTVGSIQVEYQRYLPARSPNPQSYRTVLRGGDCVIVDGQGIIRAYADLSSRQDEDTLVRLVATLSHSIEHVSSQAR